MRPVLRTLLRVRLGKTGRRQEVGLAAGMVVLALGASACTGASDSGGQAEEPSSPPAATAASEPASVRFMTVISTRSFEATTAALKDTATAVLKNDPSAAGPVVLGDLDQAQILSQRPDPRAGGAQVFLLADPVVDQESFRTDPAIGTVAPHRIFVWQEPDGTTKIGYLDPAPLYAAVNAELADAGTLMSTKLATIAQAAAGAAPSPAPGQASVRLMTATSDKSFDDTTAAFQRSVSQAGATVVGQLDQAQVVPGRSDRQREGARTYFVGNPAMSKTLFQIDRAIGTVGAPLRMHIWEEPDGTTKIGYLDPTTLFPAINPELAGHGRMMADKAQEITQGVLTGR